MCVVCTFAGCLVENVPFRWRTAIRLQSTDTSTEELDPKEAQRLKDEDAAYEMDIKYRILDAALNYVPTSGWSKQTLIEGKNVQCFKAV